MMDCCALGSPAFARWQPRAWPPEPVAREEDAKMSSMIAIAVLMVAVAGPAFACDGNKTAATDSRSTTASHSDDRALRGRS